MEALAPRRFVRFLVRENGWLAREAQDAKRLLDLCARRVFSN